MASENDTRKGAATGASNGPELRLIDRRAFVGFPSLTVAPGLVISDFALLIPEVSFPFNVSGGALRYQKKKLHFGFLELQVSAEVVSRKVAEVSARMLELEDLKLHFRPGYLEAQARTKHADRVPLTFKVAFDGDGERLAVYLYDVRFYGFSPLAAAQVPVVLSRSVEELDLLPEVELRGASGFSARILPQLSQLAAVARGFKMPVLDQARLSAVEVSTQGLKLRFASGGLPPPPAPDEELLLALEGARAFADAEELISLGKLKEAREAYLKLGDANEAHPYAAERLLSLVVADPQAHELALDLAASLSRRRERSATALWAEAVVREHRGEHARASERFLALCNLSRKNQEEAAAFFAAESAARAARDHAPQMAAKALHELLGLRPDHLPSLKALARASDQAKDRAGAIRAYRRLAALARDPAEAADAHVHLARLSAQTEDDIAGARLHCEAALRLAPDHPEALYLLGELCHRSGEHLRAIKSLDRLREVAMARHEVDRVGRASLLAGRIWDEGLSQLENALLRYREAVSLMPGEAEPLYYAGFAAERLNKLQEAVAGYQQTIELAGPAPRNPESGRAAHLSHHALARLYRARLGDPGKAREHLEAALALDPRDVVALEELIPYFRASGRAADLAAACEKAAAVTEDTVRRAAYWAEAGELYRGRLGQADKAEKLLAAALEADNRNPAALEGMLALAEARRDGAQLCRCLRALAELAGDARDRVRYYRRLAVAARDLTFDLDLAALALTEVLKSEPDDLPALGELCALHRKRADMTGLAAALEQRAGAAERIQDKRLAAAALRELAQVLETRLGRVGEALVAMEKAARLNPEQGVLLDLADLSLRCERPAHARRALEDLLGALPRHAPPDRIAEIRARLGKACDQLGDGPGAIEHYAAAFPLRKLDDEIFVRLEALYLDGNFTRELGELWFARAQALVAAGRPLEAGPLLFKSARALLQLGDQGAALLRLNAVLESAPTSAEAGDALEVLANLELEKGARTEAARLFARRATLNLSGRPSARMLFNAANLAGGTAKEGTLLEQALEQDPSFAPALARRAAFNLKSSPLDALEDLAQALATPSNDEDAPTEVERLALTRLAAQAALAGGKLAEARKYLGVYSAERPDDLGVARELFALHRKAGAREELHALLEKTWPRLDGEERVEACREYAELSVELGRPAAAAEALRSLLKLDKRNVWAARRLLGLLPVPGEEAKEGEPLKLLGLLCASAEGEERAEYLVRRAQLHRTEGRADAAREDLAAAASSATHKGPLYVEVALLCEESADRVGELEAWRNAVEADPAVGTRAAPRVLELARGWLSSGALDQAKEAFALAAELPLGADDRTDAYLGLAELAEKAEDPKAAINALALASRQGATPRRVSALLRRAALLEARGELTEAAANLDELLELSPRHPEATVALKRALRRLEDYPRLCALLATEAKQAPKSEGASLFAELGHLQLEKLEDAAAAEASFKRAAKLDGRNVEVRTQLIALLSARGEVAEAAELAQEAARQLPPEAASALLRSSADHARKAGKSEVALELARAAHKLVPATGDDLSALCELLYAEGKYKQALPLQEALCAETHFAEAPERAETALLRLAELAMRQKDGALAEKALRRLVRENPQSAEGAQRLAALIERANPREALEILWNRAREAAPSAQASSALLSLARRAKAELSDLELAAKILDRAVELSVDPLEARQSLVALWREAGRTGELAEELGRVAEALLEHDQLEDAIASYEEQLALWEQGGRIEEALSALASLSKLCEVNERAALAARYERRRAALFEERQLDLEAAATALERSFELSATPETAQAAVKLARRREDPTGEASWLEHLATLQDAPVMRAATLLELGALYQDRLGKTDEAERALREALTLAPELGDAERRLLALFEREGRLVELGAYYEEVAHKEREPSRRAAMFKKAAALYRDRAGKPDAAAAALLAARAATPDDLQLTADAAQLLHATGRAEDAAEFDAVLLEKDPTHAAAFERHRAHLEQSSATQELGALLLRRAQAEEGPVAARFFLEAARVFNKGGAHERALLCEDQAFAASPENEEAFSLQRARHQGDPRKLAELFGARASALPPEQAVPLLRERAERLLSSGEAILAAEAFDELLELAGGDVPALTARAELAAQAGGPQAAQRFDRRLLQAGGDALALPVRLKAQLRLGHAALASGAFHDAADAFETVFTLDPDGPGGKEALSVLAEVHTRTQDKAGLFKASLHLARRSKAEEAEALYRRAADLFEEPKDAIDALLPLAKLRPAEERIIDRASRGLASLGRFGDLLELYERTAEVTGGGRAAELLLQAAQVAEAELADPSRAEELRTRAQKVAPGNLAALRALAAEHRRKAHPEKLRETLAELVSLLSDPAEVSALAFELGELDLAAGDTDAAIRSFEVVADKGEGTESFLRALERLEELYGEGDEEALAEVFARHAGQLSGEEAAGLWLSAAKASPQPARVVEYVQASIAAAPSVEALVLLAQQARAAGKSLEVARALVQAAELSPAEARGPLWVDAADAFEQSGRKDEARELVDRVRAAHPALLDGEELVARYGRLGDPQRALELGFGPAAERGDFTAALKLAQAAGDEKKVREATWGLVAQDGHAAIAQKLADALGEEQDEQGLLQLAALRADSQPELAVGIYERLFQDASDDAAWLTAFEELAARGEELRPLVLEGLAHLDGTRPARIDALLRQARELDADAKVAALTRACELVPARQAALSAELYELHQASGRWEAAAEALEAVLTAERNPKARAALHVKLGELYLHSLDDRGRAREALEIALTEDLDSAAAVRALTAIYRDEQNWDRFLSMLERLGRVAGEAAVAPYQAARVDAYLALGRTEAALSALSQLPQTRETRTRRAELHERAGQKAEALAVREELAESVEEKQALLGAYLDAELAPGTIRVARALHAEWALQGELLRRVAERLAFTVEGCAWAAELWRQLLAAQLADGEGWTFYGDALRRAGREQASVFVDEVGAALTDSTATPAAPRFRALPRRREMARSLDAPAGVVEITSLAMPRLHAVLQQVREGLALPELRVWLHAAGGTEAYLSGPNELVLGAGALAAFGATELSYLCALAVALGDTGALLAAPGVAVPGLEEAAVAALEAVPSPLAACRVVAQLDPRVRGTDPSKVAPSKVLPESAAFKAIAEKALQPV